jgi:hypothetical protein
VTRQRIPYTSDEIRILARQGPPFSEDQSERKCPACGHVSVRTYMHYSEPLEPGTRAIGYTWCANCWRASFYTTEAPPEPFTDPFARLDRGKIKIEFLNEQWDKGVLPQKFG